MKRDEYAIRAANSVYQPERQGLDMEDAALLFLAAILAVIFYAAC